MTPTPNTQDNLHVLDTGHAADKYARGAMIRYFDMAPGPVSVEEHEQIAHVVTAVFTLVRLPLGLQMRFNLLAGMEASMDGETLLLGSA